MDDYDEVPNNVIGILPFLCPIVEDDTLFHNYNMVAEAIKKCPGGVSPLMQAMAFSDAGFNNKYSSVEFFRVTYRKKPPPPVNKNNKIYDKYIDIEKNKKDNYQTRDKNELNKHKKNDKYNEKYFDRAYRNKK